MYILRNWQTLWHQYFMTFDMKRVFSLIITNVKPALWSHTGFLHENEQS